LFDGSNVVWMTAGTSTPYEVIDRVEARLSELGSQLESGCVSGMTESLQ
jgi:4-hydroxy-3-methylbut-2-enyl diphosphate reductase IspH